MSFIQTIIDVIVDLFELLPRSVRLVLGAGVFATAALSPTLFAAQVQHQGARVVRPIMRQLVEQIEDMRPPDPSAPTTVATS